MSKTRLHHDQHAPAAGLFDIFDNRSRQICAAVRKQLLQRRGGAVGKSTAGKFWGAKVTKGQHGKH